MSSFDNKMRINSCLEALLRRSKLTFINDTPKVSFDMADKINKTIKISSKIELAHNFFSDLSVRN